MEKLNPKIIEILKEKTHLSDNSIRHNISMIKRDYPQCTSNAAGQILARKHGTTIMQKLDKEDKVSLPNMEILPEKIPLKKQMPKRKERLFILVKYDTKDKYLKAHIDEINRAYTHKCYTSAFILCRKVIENLLVEVLRKKYPGKSKQERELYFNIDQGRIHDLKIIIKNLSNRASEFGPENKLVKLICEKSNKFKEDANDKTHSLYHIVEKKKEIDDKNPQSILDLIKVLLEKI